MKTGWWQTFRARGGGWVLVQLPVLLALIVTPLKTGAALVLWPATHPLQIAGMLAVLVGIGLGLASALTLRRALTPFPRPLAGAPLKQSGVYAWVRHPMYAGVLLAALGWSAWCLSTAGVLVTLGAAVFFDRKASREEAWLTAHHPEYRAYCKRVKKFLPGIY
ncbi:hypothetical protein HRbin30_00925 [bacterium HR30]|nr:hypothetical protein HRbin30_00925 [bacterium HR30]